jgi:hypothetical protein
MVPLSLRQKGIEASHSLETEVFYKALAFAMFAEKVRRDFAKLISGDQIFEAFCSLEFSTSPGSRTMSENILLSVLFRL